MKALRIIFIILPSSPKTQSNNSHLLLLLLFTPNSRSTPTPTRTPPPPRISHLLHLLTKQQQPYQLRRPRVLQRTLLPAQAHNDQVRWEYGHFGPGAGGEGVWSFYHRRELRLNGFGGERRCCGFGRKGLEGGVDGVCCSGRGCSSSRSTA